MKRTIQRFRGGRGIIMKELKLTKYVQTNATVLDNEFIDHYMVRANGEYVKVYLLLLRHMNHSSGYLSVSELADLLECTEKDILRALRYWKSEGLLDYLDDTPTAYHIDATTCSELLIVRGRHNATVYKLACRNAKCITVVFHKALLISKSSPSSGYSQYPTKKDSHNALRTYHEYRHHRPHCSY